MVFSLFKKKDPICGMKEEKGRGIKKYGEWFCSQKCLNEYEKQLKTHEKKDHGPSCCH
ncbi:MAG: YHS domain-containing protein [Candidatus Pacearchaeota archaeon]